MGSPGCAVVAGQQSPASPGASSLSIFANSSRAGIYAPAPRQAKTQRRSTTAALSFARPPQLVLWESVHGFGSRPRLRARVKIKWPPTPHRRTPASVVARLSGRPRRYRFRGFIRARTRPRSDARPPHGTRSSSGRIGHQIPIQRVGLVLERVTTGGFYGSHATGGPSGEPEPVLPRNPEPQPESAPGARLCACTRPAIAISALHMLSPLPHEE